MLTCVNHSFADNSGHSINPRVFPHVHPLLPFVRVLTLGSGTDF